MINKLVFLCCDFIVILWTVWSWFHNELCVYYDQYLVLGRSKIAHIFIVSVNLPITKSNHPKVHPWVQTSFVM